MSIELLRINLSQKNMYKYMLKLESSLLWLLSLLSLLWEPGKYSRYSDWLRAERSIGWSSGPSRGKILSLHVV
jgi:hypothetical protein